MLEGMACWFTSSSGAVINGLLGDIGLSMARGVTPFGGPAVALMLPGSDAVSV